MATGVSQASSHKDNLGLTESEEEFLAEDEIIRIVPNFSMEPLALASGTVGPFRPQMAVEVPLWLALALKKRQKCTLLIPDWLTAEHLSRALEEERSQDGFQPLPYHFVEITKLLFQSELQHGSDIQDAYRVRTLVEDIKDVRQHKIQEGLKKLDSATEAVKLTNLTAIEVALIRPFFCAVLSQLRKLERASEESSTQGAA